VLAASIQGPLAAIVLMLELAHHTVNLMVPLLIAAAGATVVARRIGAPSIYSARLGEPAGEEREQAPKSDDELLPPR
jgi:H+/Cl- antiporter ClcA